MIRDTFAKIKGKRSSLHIQGFNARYSYSIVYLPGSFV